MFPYDLHCCNVTMLKVNVVVFHPRKAAHRLSPGSVTWLDLGIDILISIYLFILSMHAPYRIFFFPSLSLILPWEQNSLVVSIPEVNT